MELMLLLYNDSVKLLIIGTGADIPPKGWGAVEAVIAEQMERLPKLGVEVDLINTLHWANLAWDARHMKKKFDFVHSHYDIQWPYVKALSMHFPVAMTSHFPHIGEESMYGHFGYEKVMRYFLDDQHDNFNFCISQRDVDYFKSKGAPAERLFRIKMGAKEDMAFATSPNKPDRSLYLGKICPRKCQHKYASLECIDFVGNIDSEGRQTDGTVFDHYLGEWDRATVDSETTNYGNLVLLSESENTPLVIREALMSGLGVVCSSHCTEELEGQEFITVIPDDKLDDLEYVKQKIEENREFSLANRQAIRHYAITAFGWDQCLKDYVLEIERALFSKG